MSSILICGDVYSRIGGDADYIEGVYSVPLRTCLDHVTNKHGDYLLDFLIDSYFCVLNSRLGKMITPIYLIVPNQSLTISCSA